MYLLIKHTRVYIYIYEEYNMQLWLWRRAVMMFEAWSQRFDGLGFGLECPDMYTVYNCCSKQISWIVIFSFVYECGKPDVTYHPQNH